LKITRSIGKAFDDRALAAVSQRVFQPAMCDGDALHGKEIRLPQVSDRQPSTESFQWRTTKTYCRIEPKLAQG